MNPSPPTATLTEGPAAPAAVDLPRGTQLGRYMVLERVGAGGMGRVYAAYDPDLDRRVALKVLRGDDADVGSGGVAGGRLLQEARALARLQHANVLRVHDVGASDGQVFVATELLVGQDVAAWAAAEKRPWTAVLDVFLEIGKGLEAAHAEGLVHRDVKPANMMVCDDGRVLLVDFGIAGELPAGEGGLVDLGALDGGGGARRLGDWLPAGAGTPGYMAPEQEAGGEVGPAADQYAFALSLRRVLAGASGELPAGLPRALGPILRQALEADSTRRHPSMAALLAALAAVRHSRRRRLLQVGGVLAVVALIAVFQAGRTARERSCFAGGERFGQVWTPARTQALQAKFAGSAAGDAARGAFAAVSAAVAAYGESWQRQGELFCQETRRGTASSVLLDLRNECLDQRLRELDATLALATSRDQLGPARIADMVSNLVPVAACADTRALRAPAAPELDELGRRRLVGLRELQAALRALWTAGAHEEGRKATEAALLATEGLGHLPLVAELLLQRGLFEDALVDAAAAGTLEQASLTAGASRHDRALAEALIRRVRVAGLREERFADAERYARLARAALGGLGRPALLEAELDDFEALIARQRGDYPRALELHQKALGLRQSELGQGHAALAASHLRLGNLLDEQNKQAEARGHLEKALALYTAQYGPSHPKLAETLTALGTMAREEEDLEGAQAYHERALAIRRQVYGEGRVPLAESRTYLGELLALQGDLEGARREFAAALAIVEKELGVGHSHRAVVLATMASAFTEAGYDREAIEPYREAMAMFAGSFGAAHPQVGALALNLGAVHLRLGELTEARDHYGRAADIFAAASGKSDPLYLSARIGFGDTLERLGRPAEAVDVLQETLALDSMPHAGGKSRADRSFALARALLSSSPDPARADTPRIRQLVSEALTLYRNNVQASSRELAELEAWMRLHPGFGDF